MASVSCASVPIGQLRPSASKAAALPAASKQSETAAKSSNQKGTLCGTALPFPMANPFMQMSPFFPARSLMPMMPFGPMMMPGMVLPASGKGSSSSSTNSSNSSSTTNSQQVPTMPPMMPMMPSCFPHPAQLQAMSAAAQAAMAQATKAGMPFPPPGMMLPPFMFPMQPPSMQQTPASAASNKPAQAGSSPATAFTTTVGRTEAADEDDDTDCVLDDCNIEVDPETEQLFEKVAAMEREKCAAAAQAARAHSPCPSIHSACTEHAGSHPCSPTHTSAGRSSSSAPVSAAVFEEAASLAPAVAGTAADDAVPVPWLSFAADDGVDDIDDDLAQIITLPGSGSFGAAPASAGKCAAPSSGAPAAAGPSMKRVGSVDSAFSAGEALAGSVAAAVASGAAGGATASPAGQTSSAGTAVKPKSKLIKIKTTKGPASAAAAAKNNSSNKTGKPAKYPASKAGSKAGSQHKAGTAAAAGLGPAKSGVQKLKGSSSPSKCSKLKPPVPTSTAAKLAVMNRAALVKQQPVVSAEPSLSLLDDLHSGLSDTCLGVTGNDDMGIDSFDYLGGLLQEASDEDAWDGLLADTGDDMELCSALQA